MHILNKKTSLLRDNFDLFKKFVAILMGQNDLAGLLRIIQKVRQQGTEAEQNKMWVVSNIIMHRLGQDPTPDSQISVHLYCKAFVRPRHE